MNDQTNPGTTTVNTTVDIDNLPPVVHQWVERGIKLSCEGANHPTHWVYLKKPKAEG